MLKLRRDPRCGVRMADETTEFSWRKLSDLVPCSPHTLGFAQVRREARRAAITLLRVKHLHASPLIALDGLLVGRNVTRIWDEVWEGWFCARPAGTCV